MLVTKNFIRVRNRFFIGYLIYIFNLVKHILNPLGLAKYEIRQNDKVIADVR